MFLLPAQLMLQSRKQTILFADSHRRVLTTTIDVSISNMAPK